jgi:hypothetical protein
MCQYIIIYISCKESYQEIRKFSFCFNTLSFCITKKLSGEVGSQVSLYRAVNDDSWEVDVASFWMK